MTEYNDCIELLTVVAEAFGQRRTDVVFVGGAIAGLLITATPLQDVRPTDDVDVVVEASTYAKYNLLLEDLRKLGFAHDINGPICRFTVHGIKVDVMPTEESVLGFKNRWYPQVVQTAKPYSLPNGTTIRLITAPLFICTKLEAFRDRGKNDFISSADIEDIVAVINGRRELIGESWGTSLEVRDYLKQSFAQLLDEDEFLNALPGILPRASANREQIVKSRIEQLSQVPLVEIFSGHVEVNYADDLLSVSVLSMEGISHRFMQRTFESTDEFLSCLTELGISADRKKIRSDAVNQVRAIENVSLETMGKWGLLHPLR